MCAWGGAGRIRKEGNSARDRAGGGGKIIQCAKAVCCSRSFVRLLVRLFMRMRQRRLVLWALIAIAIADITGVSLIKMALWAGT